MVDGSGVYKDFDPTLRKSINTGYIIIPSNVDRKQFIMQCLRTERFSLLVEGGGGVMHNCYITKSAIRDIKFPTEKEQLGSGVVFFTEPYAGKAIITGVISSNGDTDLNEEDILVLKRSLDGNYALVSVDGKGQINIDIIGTAQRGKLNINVRNDDLSGEVNLHVKGTINVYSEGNTNVTAVDGNVNVSTNKDIVLSNNKAVVTMDKTGVVVNAGDQDILLHNQNSSVGITDSGVEIDTDKSIIVGGQFNVLYSTIPDAAAIMDVSEIGVSKIVKVG